MPKELVTFRLPKDELKRIDSLIKSGHYGSRTEAIRKGIELLQEKEFPTSLAAFLTRKYLKPSITLEETIEELDKSLITRRKSGEIIDNIREARY